jgi:streptomycin 3"-adenylyltransferase
VQVDAVDDLIRAVLGPDVVGMYLYGSAVAGGLRRSSDLDLFVISGRPSTAAEKRTLIERLLPISGSRAVAGPARSIELTIVVQGDVRPWRYPPLLDFQYGDWMRAGFERGELPPWPTPSPDLAVLLTTVIPDGVPLVGPPPTEVLDAVPRADLDQAMLDALPSLLADLESDTGNVILTLARIWTTLVTGEIWSKDAAAERVLARLPAEHRPVLARACAIYTGNEPEGWDDILPRAQRTAEYLEAAIRAEQGRDSAHRGER